ncbi:MAG: hypothetical protein U0401_32535, partial [Anaerolineae bacterium]
MHADEIKLAAYLDDELAVEERALVEQQLSALPRLQALWRQLRQENEQVTQSLDSLTPPAGVIPPAVVALKRLRVRLEAAGQMAPGSNEAATPNSSPIVWESPSLLAEFKAALKTFRPAWKQSVTTGLALMILAAVIIVVSGVTLVMWPELERTVQIAQPSPPDLINRPILEAQTPQTTTVVIALQPIGRGSQFTPSSIGRRSWPTRNLPAGFIATEAE